jgi:6-pyruvoyltetrahydropterin/6-carboxytetrahydropterin synthase
MNLTRVYGFSASHRLHALGLSPAENEATYGRCNNPHGHGHNYRLEVSVEGTPDASTGQLVDRNRLDEAVRTAVIRDFDHRDLNREVPDLTGRVPTTEVVAEVVRARLVSAWRTFFPENKPQLARVRIYETRNNVFEVVPNETQ